MARTSLVPWIISGLCLLLVVYILINNHKEFAAPIMNLFDVSSLAHDGPDPRTNRTSLFSFVSYGLHNCTDLFVNQSEQQFFPDSYLETSQEHRKVIKDNEWRLEGHSGSLLQQRMVFWTLAQADFVRTVCETGFNAGHSALLWLNAKPNIQLYSFDLGSHNYTRPMFEYLSHKYPGRINVTWGDSTVTLPAFHRQHPDVTCDLVLIDGGHTTQVADSDFYNFRSMVSGDNVVIMDDYPSTMGNFMRKLGKMWETKKQTGEVIEVFGCQFDNARGFSVGRYNV